MSAAAVEPAAWWVGAALLSLLGVELLLGCVVYPLRRGTTWYRMVGSTIWRFDPRLGFAYRPNLVVQRPTTPLPTAPRGIFLKDHRTGAEGFLCQERVAELAARHRLIFCLGDSVTAGTEAPHGRAYPAVLDRLVRPQGYRVINAAVGGYRSIHERLWFEQRILPYRPAAILMSSGYNDVEDAAYGYARRGDPFAHCLSDRIPRTRLGAAAQSSALIHVLRRRLAARQGRGDGVSEPPAAKLAAMLEAPSWLEEWREHLSAIAERCRQEGIRFILVSHVSPVFEGASEEDKRLADGDLNMSGRFDLFLRYLQLIEPEAEALCGRTGGTYLDLRPAFERHCRQCAGPDYARRRYRLFIDRMHLSEEGHAAVAELLHGALREQGLCLAPREPVAAA